MWDTSCSVLLKMLMLLLSDIESVECDHTGEGHITNITLKGHAPVTWILSQNGPCIVIEMRVTLYILAWCDSVTSVHLCWHVMWMSIMTTLVEHSQAYHLTGTLVELCRECPNEWHIHSLFSFAYSIFIIFHVHVVDDYVLEKVSQFSPTNSTDVCLRLVFT